VQESRSLPIGCVKYLNARPLIRGWPGSITFDHPSALTDQLQRGALQIALVSSLEFLRNPIYRVVDGVSISSDGPIYSVVVGYRGQISEMEEIVLDPASLTSIALLRCLMVEFNLHPRLIRASPKSGGDDSARLLIGDQAIRFRQKHARDFKFWDLGEAWKEKTGLAFVFALWLVRPETPEAEVIAEQLRELRDKNLRDLEQLISEEKDFDREFCRRYFRNHVRFNFGEKEKEGLRTFAASCAKQGLIPERDLVLDVI
jgi:chorismate dehydratase